MVKQTVGNNKYLKEMKALYNEPTYKAVSKLVNDGEQDVAEYAMKTGLFTIVDGVEASRYLLKAGVPAKKLTSDDEIHEYMQKWRNR